MEYFFREGGMVIVLFVIISILYAMAEGHESSSHKRTKRKKNSNSWSLFSNDDSRNDSADDFERGIRDGINDHERGGFNPGRNTSRRYQEGYRLGFGEPD